MRAKQRTGLYGRIRDILEAARTGVARTVNTTQVVANWLIGREIVEEEQKGRRRARYGKRLVESLSRRITEEFGPVTSVQGLFYMKQFFLAYPGLLPPGRILHALRGELEIAAPPGKLHAARGVSDSVAPNPVRPKPYPLPAWGGEPIGHTPCGESSPASALPEVPISAGGKSWNPANFTRISPGRTTEPCCAWTSPKPAPSTKSRRSKAIGPPANSRPDQQPAL